MKKLSSYQAFPYNPVGTYANATTLDMNLYHFKNMKTKWKQCTQQYLCSHCTELLTKGAL